MRSPADGVGGADPSRGRCVRDHGICDPTLNGHRGVRATGALLGRFFCYVTLIPQEAPGSPSSLSGACPPGTLSVQSPGDGEGGTVGAHRAADLLLGNRGFPGRSTLGGSAKGPRDPTGTCAEGPRLCSGAGPGELRDPDEGEGEPGADGASAAAAGGRVPAAAAAAPAAAVSAPRPAPALLTRPGRAPSRPPTPHTLIPPPPPGQVPGAPTWCPLLQGAFCAPRCLGLRPASPTGAS